MALRWALNSATVMRVGWDDELRLWERHGWHAAEVWYDKALPVLAAGATVAHLAEQMASAGVRPVGVCPAVVWTAAQNADPVTERDELARRLDFAAELGSPSLTVVVVGRPGDDLGAEYASAADKLHGAVEMAVERGVAIGLEFLAGQSVCGTLAGCLDLVRAVEHPALGVVFDLCHYYVSASHLEDLSMLPPDRLLMVHVDDVLPGPMEQLTGTDRGLLGQGRLDLPKLLSLVREHTGYDGWHSVELYDERVWAMDPDVVLRATAAAIARIEEALGS